MPSKESVLRSSSAIRSWVITLTTIVVSLSGIVLALICIYSLPDRTTRPFIGAFFYFFSTLILIFYFLLMWKKDKAIETNLFSEAKTENMTLVVKESLSDKILKWLVAIFTLFFTFSSLSMALICIYSLPDKTVQPQIGILYFISGITVLGVLIFVVWKNWGTTKS